MSCNIFELMCPDNTMMIRGLKAACCNQSRYSIDYIKYHQPCLVYSFLFGPVSLIFPDNSRVTIDYRHSVTFLRSSKQWHRLGRWISFYFTYFFNRGSLINGFNAFLNRIIQGVLCSSKICRLKGKKSNTLLTKTKCRQTACPAYIHANTW